MVSRRIAAALAAFALCVGAPAAHAQVYLLNDNFNTENGGVGQLNYTGFANWNVSGAVDLIGNGFFDFYPGNGLYVDMNGSPGPGTMTSKTTYNFLPGNVYTLSFDLAGSARGLTDTVDVSLGSLYSNAFTYPSGQGYTMTTDTFTVSSPTSANLVFNSLVGPNADIGLILDNVTLSYLPPSANVPEPGPLALLVASGVTGSLWMGKRWRKPARA